MVYAVFTFFAFLIWALTQRADTLKALLVTPVWFVVLGIGWVVVRRRPRHLERYEAFRRELEEERDRDEARSH